MPAPILVRTASTVTARVPGLESPPPVIQHTQTNMPRWGTEGWGARPVPTGASLVVFAFGSDAARLWPSLLGTTDPTAPAHLTETTSDWSPAIGAALDAAIEQARAGSRLVLVGPEPTLLLAIAVARAAGVNEDEIVAVAVGTVAPGVVDEGFNAGTCLRPVFCARCHSTYTAYLAIGDGYDCPVCDTPVALYYHYSPLRGAYLARPTGEDPSKRGAAA